MNKFYINIGRQVGSGGLEIGKRLSSIFSIPYFDKELINLASNKSGINKEFFENADESPNKFKSSFLELGFGTNFGIANYKTDNIIGGDNLFNIQSDVIKEEASKSSAIFIGRCADYILRETKNTLNIFIYADINDRIERIKQAKKINDKEISDRQIAEIIKKEDKKRAEYYNYYTFKKWGDKESYHICLDSSKLGIDMCVKIIEQAVRNMLNTI